MFCEAKQVICRHFYQKSYDPLGYSSETNTKIEEICKRKTCQFLYTYRHYINILVVFVYNVPPVHNFKVKHNFGFIGTDSKRKEYHLYLKEI